MRYFFASQKNNLFAIWAHFLPQLFTLKTPKYTKYSDVSKASFGTKSVAQIIKNLISLRCVCTPKSGM